MKIRSDHLRMFLSLILALQQQFLAALTALEILSCNCIQPATPLASKEQGSCESGVYKMESPLKPTQAGLRQSVFGLLNL